MIAALAPLTLVLPLALTSSVSAMSAPINRSHPTPLTCEIKAPRFQVSGTWGPGPSAVTTENIAGNPVHVRWTASVGKKGSADNVRVDAYDNGRPMGSFMWRIPTMYPAGDTRGHTGKNVLKISVYDPATHQRCVDTTVVTVTHS